MSLEGVPDGRPQVTGDQHLVSAVTRSLDEGKHMVDPSPGTSSVPAADASAPASSGVAARETPSPTGEYGRTSRHVPSASIRSWTSGSPPASTIVTTVSQRPC